jgi:hypothetical protein
MRFGEGDVSSVNADKVKAPQALSLAALGHHFLDFCLSDFSIGMVITLWSVVSPS